jgi:hypothetical protein
MTPWCNHSWTQSFCTRNRMQSLCTLTMSLCTPIKSLCTPIRSLHWPNLTVRFEIVFVCIFCSLRADAFRAEALPNAFCCVSVGHDQTGRARPEQKTGRQASGGWPRLRLRGRRLRGWRSRPRDRPYAKRRLRCCRPRPLLGRTSGALLGFRCLGAPLHIGALLFAVKIRSAPIGALRFAVKNWSAPIGALRFAVKNWSAPNLYIYIYIFNHITFSVSLLWRTSYQLCILVSKPINVHI